MYDKYYRQKRLLKRVLKKKKSQLFIRSKKSEPVHKKDTVKENISKHKKDGKTKIFINHHQRGRINLPNLTCKPLVISLLRIEDSMSGRRVLVIYNYSFYITLPVSSSDV